MPLKRTRKPASRKRESKKLLIEEEEVLLSKERTALSFMRTALTFIGVGIVVANVLKDVIIFQALGYLLVLVGVVELIESFRRLKNKQKTINRLEKRTGV